MNTVKTSLLLIVQLLLPLHAVWPGIPPGESESCASGVRPEGAPEGAIAVVNGVWIYLVEVDHGIDEQLSELGEQLAQARAQEAYLQVNSMLLEQEAQRRGISTTELLEVEVRDEVANPTAEEARQFYDENKERIVGKFEDLQNQIIQYLRTERGGIAARQFVERLRASSTLDIVSRETLLADVEGDDGESIIAVVNGESISTRDLQLALAPIREQVDERVHQLRRESLEILVNDVLLEQEALVRKIPVGELLAEEVKRRAKAITKFDARRYYDQHRNEIAVDVRTPEGLEAIMKALTAQEKNRAEQAFAKELWKTAEVRVFLPVPESPTFEIDIDDQPTRGPADSPATVVVFLDFQCEACAWLHSNLEKLIARFAGSVQVVVRDFPLERHDGALGKAIAAEAAREQGKYWEYAAMLFSGPTSTSDEKLLEYAARLGLDLGKFRSSFSGEARDKVERDRCAALRLGLDATPAVFVNGRRVRIKNETALEEAIQAVLQRVGEDR